MPQEPHPYFNARTTAVSCKVVYGLTGPLHKSRKAMGKQGADRNICTDKSRPGLNISASLPQMRLLGSTALEEDGEDDRTSVPMDFLMEVMETREALEECSSKEEAEAILAETSAAVEECLRGMDEVLKAGGGKDELSDAAVRLRYLYRIEDEARRVMHRLEDGLASPAAG